MLGNCFILAYLLNAPNASKCFLWTFLHPCRHCYRVQGGYQLSAIIYQLSLTSSQLSPVLPIEWTHVLSAPSQTVTAITPRLNLLFSLALEFHCRHLHILWLFLYRSFLSKSIPNCHWRISLLWAHYMFRYAKILLYASVECYQRGTVEIHAQN
jgi:hypothetical protein